MSLLSDALEAIYQSRWRFRTLRATGLVDGRGHRLWVVRPDRLRAEEDAEDGTRVIVRSGPDWWMWSPGHGGISGSDREVHLGHRGALTHLLDPTPLLGVARLEALGEARVIGRPAIALGAVPRTEEEVIEPGWYVGPAGLELAIDGERGIALSAGTASLSEVAFDEDIPEERFVMRFPPGERPKEARIVPPRILELAEAKSLVGFAVLFPRWLPEGTRLVRCLVPGEGPPDGLHLGYVVDPGAIHHIQISQGPRVVAEEPTAWNDWRTEAREGTHLQVREDADASWHRAMVLLERHGTGVLVSSDLPLEVVVRIALSMEPER